MRSLGSQGSDLATGRTFSLCIRLILSKSNRLKAPKQPKRKDSRLPLNVVLNQKLKTTFYLTCLKVVGSMR